MLVRGVITRRGGIHVLAIKFQAIVAPITNELRYEIRGILSYGWDCWT